MSDVGRSRRTRRIVFHVLRVALFLAVIVLIRFQHARMRDQATDLPGNSETALPTQPTEALRKLFPEADTLVDGREVLDSSGEELGYVLQTSPGSDHLIGFSGPTNTLIGFDNDDRIVGIEILSSGDTRDHVAQVRQDESFMKSFQGLSWQQAASRTNVDAVSGATLTSLAIHESIIHRLSGGRPSLRFPDPLLVGDIQKVFEMAHAVEQDEDLASLWHVIDKQDDEIGTVLRTSPYADNIPGYQGPTETRICFDFTGKVVGISLGKSYDNEKYVTYVRDDKYFLTLFNELKLDDLATLDLFEAQVEGVSGATMTSMSVADGLIVAADEHLKAIEELKQRPPPKSVGWAARDFGTAAIIVVGLVIAFTSLRGNKILRVVFQILLIGYLGFINGDMISQAMLVGWAQNRVPWSSAGGLVILTCAAFLIPITSRRNSYCTHLCPHGAAQYLIKNRLSRRVRLPRWLAAAMKVVPALLLGWCIIVAMTALPYSLVDIEPFDAWLFRVAGWATLTIAIVGLIASLFVPMAYCRFGCPTGALLRFLRFNSLSDRWAGRDWLAVSLVGLALVLCAL